MKFQLNEVEEKKAKEFIEMCHLIEGYGCNSVNDKRALQFHYVFSRNSGIGQASAIECEELGIGISLTDFGSW